MDGYRVFTWSPTRYPAPAATTDETCANRGSRLSRSLIPASRPTQLTPTFAEGVRTSTISSDVPMGRSSPVWSGLAKASLRTLAATMSRARGGDLHQPLLDAGVAGIWDDMNEPALTDRLVPGAGTPHGTTMAPDAVQRPSTDPTARQAPHASLHNAYGMQMARATREGLERLRPNERAFVLTRAGYAGIERYAAIWTGDNQQPLGASSTGGAHVPQPGHVRNAARRDSTLEGFGTLPQARLLTRFTQLGALFPLFRNHCAMSPAAAGAVGARAAVRGVHPARRSSYATVCCPTSTHSPMRRARTGAPITRPMLYSLCPTTPPSPG